MDDETITTFKGGAGAGMGPGHVIAIYHLLLEKCILCVLEKRSWNFHEKLAISLI